MALLLVAVVVRVTPALRATRLSPAETLRNE
jgi:ABC-type lipoprotein release transport system permease subunit